MHRLTSLTICVAIVLMGGCDRGRPAPSASIYTLAPIKLPESTSAIGMEFTLIPAGKFAMGEGVDAQEVTLTKPFQMSVHEVTQAQYEKVMGVNPSSNKGADNPVENVSWADAVMYCRRLSRLPAEKAAGNVYRLPTEAEWEYACRAGTKTKYGFGENDSWLGDYAWFDENSGYKTHPVGIKLPNAWGLHDMHGNVLELCQDWYGEYPSGAATDPTGPTSGSMRVFRGGSFGNLAAACRSANRFEGGSNGSIGFRVAMSPSSQTNNPNPIALPESADSIGMKFKLIPTGTFTMGEGNEAHDVTLTKPFQMGVREVTQEQYEKVMGVNPSICFDPTSAIIYGHSVNPADSITWDDASAFCRRLSALPAEKAAGNVYRLPTEAEWEFCCRAGTTTDYSFGDDRSVLGQYAWFHANSEKTTHPSIEYSSDSRKPNAWGLYDMHGNVWEWCQDWHGKYPRGSVRDPTGPTSGSRRVLRGGSWGDSAEYLRSAFRGRDEPSSRRYVIGFRVVLISSGK